MRPGHRPPVPEELALLGAGAECRACISVGEGRGARVSVERRPETAEPVPGPVTPAVFKPVAERFAAAVRRRAAERGYDDLEVDCTTIAVDIQRLGVGKDLGTSLAFDWLHGLG